ncbi:hypothetical protein PSCICG_11020 [Pseudomonas cichorii]|nr:hypothetical protein PSCICG_11020 [Pseudomonas cichorii]
MNCFKNPSLSYIYLEDSYVYKLTREGGLAFELETVLTEDHPKYKGPKNVIYIVAERSRCIL